MLNRILAIDWSGRASGVGQRKHIWVADWCDSRVTLTSGRTREETIALVIDASQATPAMVAGFDFAFSYPAWFLDANGCVSAPSLWRQVKEQGETWLAACAPPFWGRPAKRCPHDHRAPLWKGFRVTERDLYATGRTPSSPFKVGGAGAVGTGSMRGMPHLLTLRESGFCIWPFDLPRYPMAIEIYPRIFTGSTKVTQTAERSKHLARAEFRGLPSVVLAAAEHSADAFDALCALMGMVAHREQLASLPAKPERAREGEIWMPRQM